MRGVACVLVAAEGGGEALGAGQAAARGGRYAHNSGCCQPPGAAARKHGQASGRCSSAGVLGWAPGGSARARTRLTLVGSSKARSAGRSWLSASSRAKKSRRNRITSAAAPACEHSGRLAAGGGGGRAPAAAAGKAREQAPGQGAQQPIAHRSQTQGNGRQHRLAASGRAPGGRRADGQPKGSCQCADSYSTATRLQGARGRAIRAPDTPPPRLHLPWPASTAARPHRPPNLLCN